MRVSHVLSLIGATCLLSTALFAAEPPAPPSFNGQSRCERGAKQELTCTAHVADLEAATVTMHLETWYACKDATGKLLVKPLLTTGKDLTLGTDGAVKLSTTPLTEKDCPSPAFNPPTYPPVAQVTIETADVLLQGTAVVFPLGSSGVMSPLEDGAD